MSTRGSPEHGPLVWRRVALRLPAVRRLLHGSAGVCLARARGGGSDRRPARDGFGRVSLAVHPTRRWRAEPARGGRRALRALRERVGVPGLRSASATVPDLAVLGAHHRHIRRLGKGSRRLPGDGNGRVDRTRRDRAPRPLPGQVPGSCDRTPQPARVVFQLILAAPAGLGLSSAAMINRPAPSPRKRLRGNHF